MIPRPAIQDVIVPLATPVKEDGRPHLADIADLAKWLLDAGVSGLFVAGTTGRFSHFTPQENATLCREVVSVARGRVPVLGGIADSGLRRVLANAERMAAAGADYLVVTAPFYLRYTDAERERVLENVLERAPLPVVLYNIPDLVGATLRAEWILEVARHPNCAGLKDSSNHYPFFERILAERPKGFVLIQGKEPLLARSLLAGADGIVVSLSHLNPRLFVELCRAARRGDRPAVEQYQQQVSGLFERLATALARRTAMSTLLHLLEDGLATQQMPVRLLGKNERDT